MQTVRTGVGAPRIMLDLKESYRWVNPDRDLPPVFEPADREECRSWIAERNQERAAVLIAGAGSHWFLGDAPQAATHVLSLRKLDNVLEHSPEDLTVTAQAGCSLARLNEALASCRQFLPFDPVQWRHATLGGIVAANLSGPLRASFGGPRELVIGMEVVHPEGIITRPGGKVVKNAAGYDLCRLYTGSMGTLGIITEVSFKVLPKPTHSCTLLLPGRSPEELLEEAHQVRGLVAPGALELVKSGPALPLALPEEGPWWLAVRLLDPHALLEWKRNTILSHFPGAVEQAGTAEKILWDNWHDAFSSALAPENGVTVLRTHAPPSRLPEILRSLKDRIAPSGVSAHLGDGTLYYATRDFECSAWSSLRDDWIDSAVYGILFKADREVKREVGVWGPTSQPYELMKQIKNRLDPRGILNPGRFYEL
jgi:glycolate oxidase FAD binding subunit